MSNKIERHVLSKSTFIRGCQCPKALYLYKHHPELKQEISVQQQAVFDRGTNVGELAQQLFPGGIDASPATPYLYHESVAYTKKLIDEGVKIIYEAAFQFDGVLAAIDILVKKNGKWKGYEVKSSTSISETYVLDASLQYYVITNSGLPLIDVSIIHINNQYVRNGELDLSDLFITESILSEVLDQQEFVEEQIAELKKVLKKKEVPQVDIGPHCYDPYSCVFIDHCWSHIPEVSVFDIAGLQAKKKYELYSKGAIKFEDLEGHDLLNEKQQQQVALFLNKKNYIDKRGIKEFMNEIDFPLYFLDFETFNPAIPLYDRSKPYQQIPFQYSLHFIDKKGSLPKHAEFLAESSGDPRIAFIEKLLADTARPGDILTYNRSFEAGRLNELANDFPKYSKEINKRIDRIKDLMKPFQQRLYYTHTMQGSYSIKQVLPALVPELNYDNLPINNGSDASLAFMRMIFDSANDHSELRMHMLDYCRMDTWAMVKIFEKLNSIR